MSSPGNGIPRLRSQLRKSTLLSINDSHASIIDEVKMCRGCVTDISCRRCEGKLLWLWEEDDAAHPVYIGWKLDVESTLVVFY